MAATMVREFPEVEKAARIFSDVTQVKKGDEWIEESRVAHADSSLFDVFTLPLIQGRGRGCAEHTDKIRGCSRIAASCQGKMEGVVGGTAV
jgi:putative ABC transport system permease protein